MTHSSNVEIGLCFASYLLKDTSGIEARLPSKGVNNVINLAGNNVLTSSRVGDFPKSVFHKRSSA